MTGDSQSGVSRRTYLKLAGGAAAGAALAGCADGGQNPTATQTAPGDGGSGEESTTATTSDGGDGGGQGEFPVTITQGQMPSGLDPHDHRETPTDTVMLHVYEGVLTRNASGKIQSSLATDYTRGDGNTAKFTLRDGVKFHNGNALKGEDVAYSINRIVKENVGFASPQSDQLAGVTGASASGNTVTVENEGLNPIVFSEFATYCDVMQKQWTENHKKSYIGQNMMGTGPFKLDSYTEDEEVVMVRNEDYWKNPAAVSKLTFRAASEDSTRVNQLLQGETDLTVNIPPQEVQRVNNSNSATVKATPSTRLLYTAMRYDVEPFKSVKFRQAMNYAIDLESIIKNVLGSFGAQTGQPTLKDFTGHNPNLSPYPYDAKKAEQLVEESGFAGAEVVLHTPVGRYLKDFEIAQAVAGYIDELPNVTASVKQRDFGSLVDELTTGKIADKPKWFLIGWGEATFDGGLVMQALLASDGALTTWQSDEFDSLLQQANQQTDDKRSQTLQQANKLAHDQAPWIFLNRQFSVYGVSNDLKWTARSDERIDAYAIQQK